MIEIIEKNNMSNAGRKTGGKNIKCYKWEVLIFDKERNTFKQGKFCTINQLNEEFGLNLNSDYVKRIMTNYRADLNQRNKENSFLQRWGHITIKKINESIV